MDMIAAGFGGFCYYFEGKNDGTLKQSIEWTNKSGKLMQCGHYYDVKARSYANDKSLDKRFATKMDYAKAVDWDNDGDLDLVFSGGYTIKLRINEGTKKSPKFAIKDKLIYKSNDCGYVLDIVDWNNDGLFDLISSKKSGQSYLHKNIGAVGNPKFSAPVLIVDMKTLICKKEGGGIEYSSFSTCDYNNDGKLDLIVGVKSKELDPNFKMTKEKEIKIQKYEVEVNECKKKLESIYQKYFKQYGNREEALKHYRLDKEHREIYRKKAGAYGIIHRLKNKFIKHGNVYVLLRK